MRGMKILISTTALLAGLALMPVAQAQISINIGVQPVCSYGYYGYAPYGCAPMGYYGSGYFYNGIFVGMGPWAGWGYSHGWGGHRFSGDGGGNYHGGIGRVVYGGRSGRGQAARSGAHMNAAPRAGGARPSAGHGSSHASAPHGGGSSQAHGGTAARRCRSSPRWWWTSPRWRPQITDAVSGGGAYQLRRFAFEVAFKRVDQNSSTASRSNNHNET